MRYVISIDQSTSSSKIFLIDEAGEIVKSVNKPHRQSYPAPLHVEHDMEEIYENVVSGIEELFVPGVCAIAISNQRETTVLWSRKTGLPLCPAVVWQDLRGQSVCDSLSAHADEVFERTGLRLSPYFSAAKAAAVLQKNPDFKTDDLCVGTVDSYLIYRLTGGKTFACDISNASRTQLLNLKERVWDEKLCAFFGISPKWLPEIRSSDANFGETERGVPIIGVMGDSHAALFGQGCHKKGMAKATYGTGSSVMMNVGETPVLSKNGLSASVGFGFRGNTCYVLEGNVTSSGDTLCWLRDEAGMFPDIDALSACAETVDDTQGIYFVPAFSGLGAPYFYENARAILCGMTRGTTKAHIARAAIESMAFQDADIIAAMEKDTNIKLEELRTDGGPTKNEMLMQFQADIADCPVITSSNSALSPLGVAYMALLSLGIFKNFDEIVSCKEKKSYTPKMDSQKRQTLLKEWHSAIERSMT